MANTDIQFLTNSSQSSDKRVFVLIILHLHHKSSSKGLKGVMRDVGENYYPHFIQGAADIDQDQFAKLQNVSEHRSSVLRGRGRGGSIPSSKSSRPLVCCSPACLWPQRVSKSRGLSHISSPKQKSTTLTQMKE